MAILKTGLQAQNFKKLSLTLSADVVQINYRFNVCMA